MSLSLSVSLPFPPSNKFFKIFKNKKQDSVSSLWDNFKHSKICITGVPEGEGKKQETGNLFEKIMKTNFPNLLKEIDMQVQKAQGPNKMDAKRPTPRHIILKCQRLGIKRES